MATMIKDDNVSSLKSAGQNLRTLAGETAEEARIELRDAAEKAGRKVRSFLHTAGDDISHATDAVTTQIRSNPVQSSLIALGVGLVLGALFRR